MYLKSLEVTGFKSFAKKGFLEFNAPISGIVGPNGSGKSNIAEAFRFVLGEQSIKSLRGKRGEDLIFNGSTKVPRQNRAGVKVIFDNTKRALDIDFDEVAIERVVHRDSTNEYLINGSQVRLKDIIELLAGAHIGASGHHIISQGEADKILNANIKERRLMIEDALGLKIFQYKKQESARKLEKTKENMESVESLRKEIAPHLKFLRKQVEKIEKSRELKEELVSLYQQYFKREDIYLKFVRADLDRQKKPLKDALTSLEKELHSAKILLEEAKGSDKKSFKILELEGKLREARVAKDLVLRDIGRVEGEIAGEGRRLVKLRSIATMDVNKVVALRDVESVADEVEKSIVEAEGLDDIYKIKSILVAIRERLKSFISKNKTEGSDVLIKESEKEIHRLQKEKNDLENEFNKKRVHEAEIEKEYFKLKEEIEKEKDTGRDAEKAVFRIMAEQNEQNGKMSVIAGVESRLKLEEDEFKRELEEARVLAGRLAVDFETIELIDTYTGNKIERTHVENEPRTAQHERRRFIEKIKIRLEELGGGAGDDVMKEFKDAEERDGFLMREVEDLEKTALSLESLIKELEEKLDIQFKEGVRKINAQFEDFFRLMFGGGEASLEVIREKKRKKADTDLELLSDEEIEGVQDAEEEGEEGIDINVSLPNKRTKGLDMLSGGERALTSIALLFAISQVNPPPFIILDETDAALDEANSKKYGDMIASLSKYSQLILITHNRETMSRAGVIYGVTMGSEGFSKLLSIQFEEAVAVAK